MQPGSERAVHSDAVHDNDIRRGDSMQTTTRSKMWLLGARYLICRGGGAVRKILRFVSMPWTWARIADKNYINLAKQCPQMPQCSFNTLIFF